MALRGGRLVGGAAAVLTACLLGGAANARPTIRASFFSVYPGAVGSRLDNLPSISGHCGVCHYQFTGAGPKNPYGEAVLVAINGQPNTDAGRQAGIRSIENIDQDADGYTTLTEITNLTTYVNTPTFPGLKSSNVGLVSGVNVNDILNYLTPTTGADTQSPTATLTAPNGGQSLVGGSTQTVTWTASDNVGVVGVDIFYRDSELASWKMIARSVPNTGTWTWHVHNTPTTAARVRVLARDAAGNTGTDNSDAVLTITATPGGTAPTTLRDFDMPGTQPFGGGLFTASTDCKVCHGGYDSSVEPGHNFSGSMMAQAARDPLFFACLAIAEQDAPSSGDMCLRCHTPFGWQSGRSNPTDGSLMNALDRDGVACDFCHRAVDPIYKAGTSPPEDVAVLSGLLPGHTPAVYANGQYVIDPAQVKRGPFTNPVAPHAFIASPFHRSSDFCGTCHDVSNPAFTRVAGADYAPNAMDQQADSLSSFVNMPLERTYSEWKNSAFPAGVYAPEFAGARPDQTVRTCQDCHMRDVTGQGCNDPLAPVRQDLPLHDMTGGNAWMPNVIAALWPGEVNPAALQAATLRAVSMLEKAATVDMAANLEADSMRVLVTVTNRSGHKLPTGYPEGRRVWLQVVARDGAGTIVYQSGAYDAATGVLTRDADARVYEAELGISPALAGALGASGAAGPGFHFALNDTLYKDNRIPPQGFTNAAFEAFGGTPVDHAWPGPGPRYADGQNYDVASYAIPRAARSVAARLYYQTTSKEYVEFLRDQNTTNNAGDDMHAAWVAHGRAAPVLMASDSIVVSPVGVADPPVAAEWSLRPRTNPVRGAVQLALSLAAPGDVTYEVYDPSGRRVAGERLGRLPAGVHALHWNGRGAGGDVGAGLFWVRARVGERTLVTQVVRLGR